MSESFNIFNVLMNKLAKRHDTEWKEAVKYAYEHYSGKELEDFLQIIDDIDQGGMQNNKK